LNENTDIGNQVQQAGAPGSESLVQQAVGLKILLTSVPWGHHVVLPDKVKVAEETPFTPTPNFKRLIINTPLYLPGCVIIFAPTIFLFHF